MEAKLDNFLKISHVTSTGRLGLKWSKIWSKKWSDIKMQNGTIILCYKPTSENDILRVCVTLNKKDPVSIYKC